VTRKTLYNWLHHDAKFQAAYNAWQLDAATRTRSKMLAMADEAVYTVGVAIKRDARLAFDVLKSLGVMERPTPGSTDPEEIQQRMKLDQMQAEADLMTNRFDASIGCLKKE
jgi:hypothetical protein